MIYAKVGDTVELDGIKGVVIKVLKYPYWHRYCIKGYMVSTDKGVKFFYNGHFEWRGKILNVNND
jgi:hypothetical protein